MVLGEDLAEAAGEESRSDRLDLDFASSSSFAIATPELSCASLGRLAGVNPWHISEVLHSSTCLLYTLRASMP